jgi:hypothetical protein
MSERAQDSAAGKGFAAGLRSRVPLVALLLFGAVAAGCPETLAQLCPTNTKQEGTFSTTITARSDGNDCRQVRIADAGGLDASIFVSSETFNAAICSSTDVDGGPVVWFALSSKLRTSALGDGGAFVFGTDNTWYTNTACNCPIVITERIEGKLIPTDADASVVLGSDGLPALQGFSGVVRDIVDAGDADQDAGNCWCNTPCTTTFDMTATKL